jgi:hypothetical protein
MNDPQLTRVSNIVHTTIPITQANLSQTDQSALFHGQTANGDFGSIKSLFEAIDSKMKVNSFCSMNGVVCSCEEPGQEDESIRADSNQTSTDDASQDKFCFNEGSKKGITKTDDCLQQNIPI